MCGLTVALLAQDQALKTNVHLVLVPTTVTDKKGMLIDGLHEDDFVVTDDSVRQKIHMDTSDTVLSPVSLVVLVQSSGISAPALARIRLVGAMIQPVVIGERGQAAVIAYDTEVQTYQEFTSDGGKIRAAFENIIPRTIRQAKMIDAVLEGMKMLATRPENYRRIMMVMGESRDRGSKHKLAEAVEMAQRAGVVIYSITYSAQGEAWSSSSENAPPVPGDADYIGAIGELVRLGKTNDADAFAKATGGRHLAFLKLGSLEAVVSRTGEEIHSQYLLSFPPQESKNSGLHHIEVHIAKFPDAVVRARPGYWPEKQP
ncbi:MAG TPA: VWA domain-containing protein [Bryobacteraceae bacterium]|jgi:VWFA-related protein|nr:VWA domain-containing protein [Bryobacteraceae bacterium]